MSKAKAWKRSAKYWRKLAKFWQVLAEERGRGYTREHIMRLALDGELAELRRALRKAGG